MAIIGTILYDLTVGVFSSLIYDGFKKQKIQNSVKEIDSSNEFPSTSEHKQNIKLNEFYSIPYKEHMGKRLLYSLELITTGANVMTVPEVCDYLNISSVTIVEEYFHGKLEPKLKFLKKYADFFGFELKWLKLGEGNKFKRGQIWATFPKNYEESIRQLSPEKIYFVRCKSDNGESGIVLKLSEFSYLILPKTYHISGNVGTTGQVQIESFYDLVKSLDSNCSRPSIIGVLLEEKVFFDLFHGKIYAGKLFSNKPVSYWWDDFLDFEHKFPIASHYNNLYGEGFLAAQDILKYRKINKN